MGTSPGGSGGVVVQPARIRAITNGAILASQRRKEGSMRVNPFCDEAIAMRGRWARRDLRSL